MDWYALKEKDVLYELNSDTKEGLKGQEATARLREYGRNTLEAGDKKEGIIRRVLRQLNDFLVIILLSASLVSFIVSYLKGDSKYYDSIIILVIVVANAILGVIQEDRAEKAIAELKKLTITKAKVIRNGERIEISSEEVVPGDIIILEAGDIVCADIRLISALGLCIEESSLTGESIPIYKNPDRIYNSNTGIGDRKNMAYSSTAVTSGSGIGIVCETGMNTEVGKIAGLISKDKGERTPLQMRLDSTGRTLGVCAIGICIIIFIIGILRRSDPFDMFMTSVSLAVAAIPEGLLAIVTIVLAIGMEKMSKKGAVIRRLPVVETLGCANVICSDKTGTLTKNKMKVIVTFGFDDSVSKNRKTILKTAILCNNTKYINKSFKGEATEAAICEAGFDLGIDINRLKRAYTRVFEVPFSSERKLMSTIHKSEKGYLVSAKGAFDVLIKKCDRILVNGRTIPLDENYKKQIYEENRSMASRALRVIGTAYKECEAMPKGDQIEAGLIFTGLIGLIDPPREEVIESVKLCKRAGIKPVMITGDHILTALAIASQIGIYTDKDTYLTGGEIEELRDEKLKERVMDCTVYARVSPAHKVRIVKAYKENNCIVAMTGDGVNDAPALKAAHIGVAMGLNGTDVAKSAADMVITDDNFATIVEAVKEGRGIYQNIRKAVHFLVSSNIGEIITIFTAMIFGFSVPLLPIQLLWVNLVTDSLPAIGLGFEEADEDIMEKKPLRADESMFSGGLGIRIATEGIMIGMLALIGFGVGLTFDKGGSHITGRTMAFATLSISQLVHVFNMRSEKSLFKTNIFGNKIIVLAFIIGIILQTSVIMIKPLSSIFGVIPLSLNQWLIVGGLCLVPVLIVEIEKLFCKE